MHSQPETDDHDDTAVSGSTSFLEIAYWSIVIGCTIAPWVAHFLIGWQAGLFAIPLALVCSAVLLKTKGSICWGPAFIFPLGSSLFLILIDVVKMMIWLMRQ